MTSTEFPIAWDDPKDAEFSWTFDRAHSPEPMLPLDRMWAALVDPGFTYAFHHYSVPVERFRMIVVNGYVYTTVELVDAPPDELQRLAGQAQAQIAGAMATLAADWENKHLPEVKALLGELEAFDLPGASTDELVAHWRRMIEIQERLYQIHFLVLTPAMLAMSEFDELYRQLLSSEDPHAAYRLLQGSPNLTVESGRALWELGRNAAPEVREVVASTDTRDVIPALERTDAGRAFLAELRTYLAFYGQRGDKWDISHPSWIEDPTPVIVNLKRYLGQETHPGAGLRRVAAERDAAVAQAREQLKDNPMLPMFDFLLKAAQEGLVLSEDHGFWIDFRGGYRFRLVALEFGRRLAASGVIDSIDDVFYLHENELLGSASDLRPLVAHRKAELEQWAALTPPKQIGAPPVDVGMEDNPLARAFAKFSGAEPAPAVARGEVRGNSGSPGIARGRARLIRRIADADRLEPGDVLVSETTSPPWTPLFAIASAVVTDAGGILSHCAVVAREYGIPAVVGCGDATQRICDGQIVEVDGGAGVVRIVD